MRLDRRFVVAAGAVATVCLLGVTGASVPAPAGVKTILDTLLGLSALITGALFFVRFRRSRDATDAAFTYGFALLGLGSITLAFGQSAATDAAAQSLALAFAIRTVGFGIVVMAAFDLPRGKMPSNPGLLIYGVAVPTLVLVVSLAGLAGAEIRAIVQAETDRTPILQAADVPWLLSTVNAGLAAALTLAALACRLRGTTEADPLFRRLALGFALLAASRAFVLLFPGAPGADIHLGDLFRMAGHGVLLWTLIGDLCAYWASLAAARANEERQSVARALHDGLAQDLALLTAQSGWLSKRATESDDLAFVAIVAEQALAESRRTISRLRNQPVQS